MVFSPQSSTGQHALDETQPHSALIGYGWRSGLSASLTGSSTAIESQWTSGSVLWNGETIDIPSGTITHDAGDASDPRWDALAVTDSAGTVQIVKGTPAPVASDDSGTEYPGEQAWTPSPSDQITRDMVVLAIVWIPAGAADNTDLTNTSSGGVNNPVVDRRMEVPGREQQVTRSATITSSGWYRIASVGPVQDGVQGTNVRASSLFSVRDTRQTLHSENIYHAQLFYDRNPTLSLQSSSYYTGTHGAITDIRMVHSPDTYEGGAIEVNVQLQGQSQVPVEYSITHNHIQQGWNPEPWTAGSIPTGFNTTGLDLSLDPIQAVAADGVDDLFVVQRDGTVLAQDRDQTNVGVRAGLSTDDTIGTTGRERIEFDTVKFDDRNEFDSSIGRFNAARSGKYRVHASLQWPLGFPGTQEVGTFIMSTGTRVAGTFERSGSQGERFTTQVTDTIDIAPGDNIEIHAQHSAGASQTVVGSTLFTYVNIERLG